MRSVVAILVLVATVATVLVGVRQHSELRRVEQSVWEEMRRRDSLERQIRELETVLATELAPRALLEARQAQQSAEVWAGVQADALARDEVAGASDEGAAPHQGEAE